MDLNYEQMSKMDIKNHIQAHIKSAEQQHLDALINITINEASAALSKTVGRTADVVAYKKTVDTLKARAEALLKGIATLKEQFSDNLIVDSDMPVTVDPPVILK